MGLKRIETGIPGLDELLNGGLPQGRSILLTGGAGTGKSIFAAQFLYKGITDFDENGILVTLEEPADVIRENMRTLGWNFKKLEDENRLTIIDAAPIRFKSVADGQTSYKLAHSPHPILGDREFGIQDITSLIHEYRRKINAKRLVFDSLTTLILHHKDLFSIRQDILTLVKTLKISKMTSLLIAESPTGTEMGRFGVEPFLAEGVIILSMVRRGNTRIRALEIQKMRGTNHSMDATLFRITKDGIVIYPGEKVFRDDQ
ncbi:MAG: ATPase domain-containing protein [Candidatus Helarchaeota archaeon]